MASKDEEIKSVVAELDAILARLRGNVGALTAILNDHAQASGATNDHALRRETEATA